MVLKIFTAIFLIFSLNILSIESDDYDVDILQQYRYSMSEFFGESSPDGSERRGRIAGGSQATLGQFPYHVIIALNNGDVSVTVMGGAYIGRNWVLTVS
jgi:hypothetical protein